jgi:LuxR family maltose regulon positive regulatory protein
VSKTTITKISRPTVKGVVPRKRLFRLLDDEEQPVLWVTGPAGSGKTSLIASYIDENGLPCLWYTIDEADADIAAFFYYLGRAAQSAAPPRRKPLPLLTPEYMLGLPTFTRRFFEELYTVLKSPCVIVFDNYHEAPEQSPLHDILNIGVSLIPEGIRVFVVSRKDPPQQFMRLRANNALHVIGRDALRFSLEETKLFAKKKDGLSGAAVRELHERTEGWAAGLVLLSGSAGTETLRELPPEGRLQPEVFDYIAGEIFDKLDGGTREFLLAAAFLPDMTAGTAEEVTGRSNAAEILAALNRDNFFTSRISSPSSAYRFHPLFRAFLQARAVKTLGRDAVTSLRRQSARALLEEGQVEDAAALLVLAEDWRAFIGLVLANAKQLITQGRNRTLQEWIEKIPAMEGAGNPWILYWSGISIMPFDPTGSREKLETALQQFETQQEGSGALLAWSAVVQTFLFEFHDFRPLDRWVDWIESRIRQDLSFASPEIEASVVTGMTGILAWRRPNLPGKERWLNWALMLPQKSRDTDACLRAYTNSALYHIWMGEFVQCGLLLHEMKNMIQSSSLSPLRLLSFKITEAMLYNSSVDHHGQAVRSIAEGLDIAEKTGVHIMSPTLFLQGVFASLNNGDLKSAAEFLQKTGQIVGEDRRINMSHYLFASAWYELVAGEKVRAAALAKKSLQLIEATGAPLAETTIQLLLAHVLYETGDYAEMEAHLSRVRDLVSQTGSAYSRFLYDLTKAHFDFERNDRESAFASLRSAFATGRHYDFTTLMYFWRPEVMGKLCGEAIEAGIEPDYAVRLVRKLGLARDERTRGGEHWPWRLKIVTFGRFALLRDGAPVGMSGKAQKKPLLMLKAVISAGPDGVHKERLIDALWPDAEGDAGNIAFHTTLSRLRRLTGDETSIQFNEGILSLDQRYCWVDAWAFELLVERFETVLSGGPKRSGDVPSTRLIAGKAVSLYKGIFLPTDQDFLPAIAARERLRSKYLRLVSRAGQSLENAGELESAVDYYTRGLEAEPLAEELHQGLIECYLRLDRKAEAVMAYQRCKNVLSAELGVEPSPKTELLFRQCTEK